MKKLLLKTPFMKNRIIQLIVLLSCVLISSSVFSQYYPGGFAHSKINLWYDAADTTTFTKSSGLITAWKDKSNNLSATQATTSAQPVLSTVNGKNTVEFNGVQGINIPTTSLLAPQNGYDVAQVVYVFPDAPTALTDFRYGTFSNSTNSQQGTPLVGLRYVTANSQYEVTAMRNNTGYYYSVYNDLRGQWLLPENYTANGSGNAYYYYNGTGNLNSNGATPSGTSISGTIGNRTNYFSSVHWGVSETVLAGFDTKVSGRTIVETYLATKWGMLDTLSIYQGSTYYYPTNTAFVNDLVGIGTQGGSDSISYTGSNNGLGLQNVNGITGFLRAPGSYIMAADNKLSGTVAEGSGGFNRWNRSWFLQKTDASGYGGLVNVYFDFTNYGVTLDTSANSYYLLYNPTNGYFNSGTNYLVAVNSYTINAGTNQLAFLLDGNNLSNGFYTIVYAPKGSSTATIPYIGGFTPTSVSVSPAPTLTSVFSGNTYNYLFIDSTALTYPVAYTKIFVSVNGGATTAIDSVAGVPAYYAHYHLTNGNTYAYTVSAVYAPGKESSQSNSVTAIPNQFIPSWGTLPQFAGSGSAYMSASTPSGGLPIKFNFKNITNNDSSGYQVSNYYTDSSLTNGNAYTYKFLFYDTTQGLATASNWSLQESVLVADSAQGGFTYNLSYLDPTTIWAPNGIGPSTITPATEDMTGLRMVEHAPAVGVHPRVFINPEDSTSIRWRLANTYSGKAAAKWIHAYTTFLNLGDISGSPWTYTKYYNLDTMGYEIINNGGEWNVQPYYNYLAAGDTSTNPNYNYSTLWNGEGGRMAYLFSEEAMECWLYRNQYDPATGLNYATRAQKLASAITTWAKKALANTTTPLNAANASQFGGANMFYVYDFLFDQMTQNQQDTVRMALMKILPDSSYFHGMQAASYTCTSNWMSFPQGVTYFFAVEGEPGYTKEDTVTVNLYERGLWNFLTYGVYSQTGNVYEGLGKDQLDITDLYAASKRGYSMLGHPSVRSFGTKYMPAIIQPFGYSMVGTDLLGGTQSNNYQYPGFSSPATGGWKKSLEDVGGLKWIFPNDTTIDYVWKNYIQKPTASSPYNPAISPNYYFYSAEGDNFGDGVGGGSYFNNRISGLLFASDYFSTPLTTEALTAFGNNKMYFDSLGGFATLRSGYDSTATAVFFANRQDMGGHTYANKNEVVYSAQGRIWFPRPSSDANSQFDALAATGVGSASGILVNNYGATIDTSASSADGGNLSVPGKIVYFQDSSNMLSIAGDATIPYSYKWYGQFGGWTGANPNLSPPSVEAVPYSPNSFRYSPFYSFDNTSYYNRLSYTDGSASPLSYLRYAQKASTPNGVYTKMYRTVSLVQATKPYVIIADDNQLNTSSNDYKWFCQLPTDVTIASTAVNLSNTNYQNDIILKEAGGNRRLLVRVLNNNGAISNTVPGYLDSTTYSLSGLNRLIVESHSVDPQFKVLLFAYNNGDSLPITTWSSDKSKVYVYNNGVTNTIAFSLNSSGRTTISLNPTDTAYYWTGSQDSLWNNPNNWSTGQVPTSSTAVIIPNIDVTTLQNVGNAPLNDNTGATTTSNEYYPYISGFTAYATSLTIDSGAYIRIDSTLQLSGNVICYGTTKGNGYLKTTSTSTTALTPNVTWGVNIEYNDSVGGQTIVAGNYKSLSINATHQPSLFTVGGNITVADTLNLTAGDTLNMATNTLTGTMLVSTGTGTLKTQSTSATDLPNGATWAGHVNYNNTNGNQTIQGGTYANLLTSNLYNIDTANGNIDVKDTINLAYRSSLDMKTYQLNGANDPVTVIGTGSLRTANTSTTGALPVNETWGGTVVYYSTSSQVIAPGTYSNLDISGGSNGPRVFCGTSDPTDTIKLTGSFTPTTGTITPLQSTVVFEGNNQTVPASSFYNLDLAGGFQTQFYNGIVNVNGAFIPGNITSAGGLGTINFSGTTVSQAVPHFYYNSLTISGAKTTNSVTLGDSIWVSGNLSLSGLSFTSGSLTASSTTILMNGTSSQSIDALTPYNNLLITNTAGTVSAVNNLTVNSKLTLVTGSTLDLGTSVLAGTFTLSSGTGNAGTLKTQSTSSNPLPNGLTYSGTVKYYSTTGTQYIAIGTYNNLDISGGTTGGRILPVGTINVAGNYTTNTGTGAVTVTGDTIKFNGNTTVSGTTSFNSVIIASSSTLTAPAANLSIAGNFTNNGTFNASTGKIIFNGATQTITGANTFNKFTKSISASDTLYLPAGLTQTFNDSLVLSGTSGNILYLLSSTPSVQATINPATGKRVISYVAVQDNLNSNSSAISTSYSYNFGDNTNWNFGASTYKWVGAVDTTWGNTANWIPTHLPATTDSVVVAKTGANNLTIETSQTVAGITINSGNTVSLSSDTLSVNGNFVNYGTFNARGGGNLFAGTSKVAGTGTTNFNTFTISSGTLTDSSSNINVSGNWTDNGTFTPIKTTTVNFNGTANQSITRVGGETFDSISVTNTGGIVSAANNITVGTTALVTIASGSTLDLGTNQLLGGASLTTSGTGMLNTQYASTAPIPTGRTWAFTVNFNNSTGTQTVVTGIYSSGLFMNNTSGTDTANGTLTVNGKLFVNSGGMFDLRSYTLTAGSSFADSGLGMIKTQGTFPSNKTWTGSVVFNSTTGFYTIQPGTYNNIDIDGGTGAARNMDVGSGTGTGTFTITGTITWSGSGGVVFNKTTVNFAGNNQAIPNFNFYNLGFTGTDTTKPPTFTSLAVSSTFNPGLFTRIAAGTISFIIPSGGGVAQPGQTIPAFNYYNLTVSGARTVNVALANSGTIGVANTYSNTSSYTSSSFVTTGSTINFNGAGTQTVPAYSYNNLTISGTRTGSVTLASSTINIAGNYTRSATFTSGSLVVTGNTLVFNGSTNQTITSATAETFNNVTINNTTSGSDTIQLSTSNFTVNGTLALTSGYLSLCNSNLTLATMPTGSSSSYIVTGGTGTLTKNSVSTTSIIFPVGTSTNYTPISIANTTGTSNLSVAVSNNVTISLNIPSQIVNLQWSVLSSAATTATMTYQFNSSNGALSFSPTTSCDLGISGSGYSVSAVGIPSGSNPYTLSKSSINMSSSVSNLFVVGNTGSIGCITGSYIGTAGSNANSASNWCGGLPTSATNVIISNVVPVLNANLSVNNISLSSGINLNGYLLTINGSVSGTGVITGSDSSSISILGTGTLYFDQSTAGTTNKFNNLTVNSSGTVTLGNALNIHGTLTSVAGTLATGGNLILLSDSTGTGRIDQVLGTISGNVTVQRYISPKSARKFSFICSPVSQSIRNSWQQQIYITGAGTGGAACGSTIGDGGSITDKYNNNGFDVTQTSTPSMFTYNATKINGSRYVSVPNTDQTILAPGTGYILNIRGNRNSSTVNCFNQLETGNPTPPEAVTLSVTGTVTSGAKSFTLYDTSLSKYTLLGNPYPSQISFSAFQAGNSSKTYNKMWTYSPFGIGNYTTYSNGIIANAATGFDNTNGDRIASGQAFFVEATQAGSNSTVTFQESHKVSGAIPNTKYFGSNSNKLLRVGLQNTSNTPLDEVVLRFNAQGTKTTYNPEWDAESFNNSSQVIKIMKAGMSLAIATLPDSIAVDTAQLNVASTSNGTFQLSFSDYQGIDPATKITLLDNFLGTTQDVRANTVYAFNVTSNTASQGSSRFQVVFSGASPLPVSFASISATKNNDGVAVQWSVANQLNIATYSVEKSTDGSNFTDIVSTKATTASGYSIEDANIPTTATTLYYRIKSIGNDGSTKYSSIAKLTIHNSQLTALSIYPNPVQETLNIAFGATPNGTYKARILTVAGVEVFSKTGIAANANTITLDASSLASGLYMIELADAKGNKQLEKFVKQ